MNVLWRPCRRQLDLTNLTVTAEDKAHNIDKFTLSATVWQSPDTPRFAIVFGVADPVGLTFRNVYASGQLIP